MPDRREPIHSSNTHILGSYYRPDALIWAGLRLHEARLTGDGSLRVPWCHVDDPTPAGNAVYRLTPRHPRGRFVRAENGAWLVEVAR